MRKILIGILSIIVLCNLGLTLFLFSKYPMPQHKEKLVIHQYPNAGASDLTGGETVLLDTGVTPNNPSGYSSMTLSQLEGLIGSGASGTMVWPLAIGIANYNGGTFSWGASYNADNQIPFSYLGISASNIESVLGDYYLTPAGNGSGLTGITPSQVEAQTRVLYFDLFCGHYSIGRESLLERDELFLCDV